MTWFRGYGSIRPYGREVRQVLLTVKKGLEVTFFVYTAGCIKWQLGLGAVLSWSCVLGMEMPLKKNRKRIVNYIRLLGFTIRETSSRHLDISDV